MAMKNVRNRTLTLTALALVFALTLGLLASCERSAATSDDGGSADTKHGESIAKKIPLTDQYRTVELEAPDGFNADATYYVNDKIYVKYNNLRSIGDIADLRYRLGIYDKTGATLENFDITSFIDEGSLYFSMLPTDDGYYTVGAKYFRKVSSDGTPIVEVDIAEEFGRTIASFDKSTHMCRDDKYVYVLYAYSDTNGETRSINELLVFTLDGEPVSNFQFFETGGRLTLSPEGGVVYYGFDDGASTKVDARRYYAIDPETWLADEIKSPELPDTLTRNDMMQLDMYYNGDFSDAYTTYYNKSDIGLFGYTPGEDPKLLINWTNSNMLGRDTSDIFVIDPETVLCMYRDTLYDNVSMLAEPLLLIKVPDDEMQSKELITLALVTSSPSLYGAVIRFNRSNEKYRIVVDDYSISGTNENFRAGEEKFDMDLASGISHDLTYIRSGERNKYIKQGLFADLYEFIDKDDTVTRDTLLGCIRTICENEGRLQFIPDSFYIYTISGKTSIIGDKESLTVDDLVELQKTLPEDGKLFARCGRHSIFLLTMYSAMNKYVDFNKGTCNYTDPSFIELLKFLKELPEENGSDMYNMDSILSSEEEMLADIRNDKAYLFEHSFLHVDSFARIKGYFGEDYTIKGYPNLSGNGSIILNNGFIGINSNAASKDGAWEFIKFLLTDEEQNDAQFLPITNAALSKQVDEVTSKYYFQKKGNFRQLHTYAEMPDPEMFNYDDYVQVDFGKEDADDIMRFMNEVSVVMQHDITIINIILEEADEFFAGKNTAEQCAELIQNRVRIYVSEQFG